MKERRLSEHFDRLRCLIRQRRKVCGLSQEELAERVEYQRNHVGLIERGVHKMSLEMFVYFSEALEVSTESLLRDAGFGYMLPATQKPANSIPVTPHVTPHVKRLLTVIGGEMTRDGLLHALGLSDRKSFRKIYLEPAIKQGLVEMTIPDKPKSILQKYRLTEKGHAFLANNK
jgi:DNA-binding XRE family transcriptional regulator